VTEMIEADLWGDGVDFAVDRLIAEWCDDPEMWGTHGRPGPAKLVRIWNDVTTLCRQLIATRK